MSDWSLDAPWRWDIPERFNIGVACTDKHLGTPVADRVAMIIEDDEHGTVAVDVCGTCVAYKPLRANCCESSVSRPATGCSSGFPIHSRTRPPSLGD